MYMYTFLVKHLELSKCSPELCYYCYINIIVIMNYYYSWCTCVRTSRTRGSGLEGDKPCHTALGTASPSFAATSGVSAFPHSWQHWMGTRGADRKTESEKGWFPTGSIQAPQRRQNCPLSAVPRPLGGRPLESCLLESAHVCRLWSEGLFWAEPLTCPLSCLVFTTTSIYR